MAKKKAKQAAGAKRRVDKSQWEEYDYHLPVMLEETISYLITEKCGIYVDGTLGGGGHAAKILSELSSGGNLIAFDKDINAIEHCKIRFEEELSKSPSRLLLVNDCYSGASSVVSTLKSKLNGLLLDLGVSSMQLDTDSRGLSYRVDARLDMRFGNEGITAEELLNNASFEEIAKILREYGEEPQAGLLARRIIERRRAAVLQTTFDLRSIVEECIPEVHWFKTLSRVFQAIRIAINGELDVLEKSLRTTIPLLAPGGRIVVMSYHSLEDRIVKNVFKEFSKAEKYNKYAADADEHKPENLVKIITPKPLLPSEEEIARNPRARSAKVRVCEKV